MFNGGQQVKMSDEFGIYDLNNLEIEYHINFGLFSTQGHSKGLLKGLLALFLAPTILNWGLRKLNWTLNPFKRMF